MRNMITFLWSQEIHSEFGLDPKKPQPSRILRVNRAGGGNGSSCLSS